MNLPKVTVIIPSFNHAQFLERRINSVLEQTYQDFEVFYLDDASTDGSDRIFAKFATDPRIKAFVNQVNSDVPFMQWNKGVRLARGEYVWIAESDDYADKDFLSRLVETLDKNPNVGLAYCNSFLLDEDGHTELCSQDARCQRDFVAVGQDECRNHLLFTNTIANASSVLFRRSIYERAGYADEGMHFCGDWLMWVKMFLISDVAFVAEPLNHFRRHSGSVSTKMSRSLAFAEERYRVARHIKRNLQLPANVLEQVCESLMDMWFEVFFSSTAKGHWRSNACVYRTACDVDPRVNIRLARKLLISCLTKCRLIAPIKSSRGFIKRLFFLSAGEQASNSKP